MNKLISYLRARVMTALIVGLAASLAACGAATTTPGATPSTTPVMARYLFIPLFVDSQPLPGGGALVAMEPETGRQLWSQPLSGPPAAAAVVAGSVVMQVSSVFTSKMPHSALAAFDTATGKVVWRKDLSDNTQGVLAAADATALLATSAVSATPPAPEVPTMLTAFKVSDGSELWRQPIPGQDIFQPLIVSDGMVFVISGAISDVSLTYTLSAYRLDTGATVWTKPLAGVGTMTGFAASHGGVFVSGVPGHIPAARRRPAPLTGAAFSAGDAVSSATNGALTAYRAQNGAVLWQASGFLTVQGASGDEVLATLAEPQTDGKTLFTVIAYDASKGNQLWQSATLGTGDIYESKPTVTTSASLAYVFNMPASPGAVGAVYALDLRSGAQTWRASLDATTAKGVADARAAYVCAWRYSQDGGVTAWVQAMSATSGAIVWSKPLHCAGGPQLA